MLFADLASGGEFADFRVANPEVVDVARRFGAQLEADCPDWMLSVADRGDLQLFPQCGSVIARQVLCVDIVNLIYDELSSVGVKAHPISGRNAFDFGRNYGGGLTQFEARNGIRSTSEERLAAVYAAAFNGSPLHLLFREYRTGQMGDGFQSSHVDNGAQHPTIAFGSGPGATRVSNLVHDGEWDPDQRPALYQKLSKHGTTDVDTLTYDIGVFPGTSRLHAGIRFARKRSRNELRRSLVLNTSN